MVTRDRIKDLARQVQARTIETLNAAIEFGSAYIATLVKLDQTASQPLESPRQRTVATAQCLPPFLKALGYRGTELHRCEAVQHFQTGMDIADLRAALELFAREIAPAGTSWAPGTTGEAPAVSVWVASRSMQRRTSRPPRAE